MTDAEKIVLGALAGVLGTLITQLIIGLVKSAWQRREDVVAIAARTAISADLGLLQTFGCPGLLVEVIGKGKRPAKINSARLCLKNFSNFEAFQNAFGSDFGYVPIRGSDQPKPTLSIKLLPISQPKQDGSFVLERDDVCRFFLPGAAPLPPFVESQSENVTIEIRLLDGTDKIVSQGLRLQDHLRGLLEVSTRGNFHLNPNVDLAIEVSARSLAPPDHSMVGRTNPNTFTLGQEGPKNRVTTFINDRAEVWLSPGRLGPQNLLTIFGYVRNTGATIIENTNVLFVRRSEPPAPSAAEPSTIEGIDFSGMAGFTGSIAVGETAHFFLPSDAIPEIKSVVASKQADDFAVIVQSAGQPLIAIPGWYVKEALITLEKGAEVGSQ